MPLVAPQSLPSRSLRVEVRYRNGRLTVRRMTVVNGKAAPSHEIPALIRDEPVSGFWVEVITVDHDGEFVNLDWRRPMTNPVRHRVEIREPGRDSFTNYRATPRETVFTVQVPHLPSVPGFPHRLRIYSAPFDGPEFGRESEAVLDVPVSLPPSGQGHA